MKIILTILALLYASAVAPAQQPTASPSKPVVTRHCCGRRVPRHITASPMPAPQSVKEPSPDFFVGEARVEVNKDETVVRLAMAQHGSVLIELPANDGPRYIIPGDPEMATVDEKALERNKRAIVVRPGSLFVSPPPNRKAHSPAATVTVQMRSGLVVTFLFYPVEDLAQNVHRCVLSYNRDEVVARRRAAGLPVNLDTTTTSMPERRDDTRQPAAPASISVETSEESKPAEKNSTESPSITIRLENSQSKSEVTDTPRPLPATADSSPVTPEKVNKTDERITSSARDALSRAIKKPGQFKAWTKPIHGLALSTVQKSDPKDEFQVVIVAIRNTTADPVKLTSGSPDLFVEMLDDQGKPINIEPIKKLRTEGSDASGAIPASGIGYYAVAYHPPVLGTHQQVKVVVSQTSAADEPASITLANNKH